MSTEDLLLALEKTSGDCRFVLDGAIVADVFKMALFLGAISRRQGLLQLRIPKRTPQTVLVNLMSTILGQIAWSEGRPSDRDIETENLISTAAAATDAERGVFVTAPSLLASHSRIAFQADLARLLRASGMVVPETAHGAIATIAFEACSNAEEYGAMDETGSIPVASRFFAGKLHNSLRPGDLHESAHYFLEKYVASGHASASRCLELVIADAGVGMSFPSYRVSARSLGRANSDVYQAEIAEEQLKLDMLLNSDESTKGQWGRLLNHETARGEGTKFMKFRLAAVRGYAAVRTGRCLAEWSYFRPELKAIDRAAFPPYYVHSRMKTLYRGTVWHILIPLDTQLALQISHGNA
jgi:hypothetical protein